MVRASAGDGSRRCGDRGLSRRQVILRVLGVTGLLLTLLIPGIADAASESEAWLSARQAWITRTAAIEDAAKHLAPDDGATADVRALRRAVAEAIHEFDALEVHDCFRIWWSYVRTSFLLFDAALVGVEKGDIGQVQIAVSSSRYLSAQARATVVDCPDRGLSPTGAGDGRPGGGAHGLVIAPALTAR